MRKTITRLSAMLVATTALTSTSARAQERSATLQQTLQLLFGDSPSFQIFAHQTREAAGAHLRALGAFDLVTGIGVQLQRSLFSTGPYGALSDQGFTDVAIQASASTLTRENVSVSVSGSSPVVSELPMWSSPDRARVSATLSIPLLKLGASAPPVTEAQASYLNARAMAALQRDEESELAAGVIASYWRWLGACQQLDLMQRIESLTGDQLRDVEQLIEQRARAQVDRYPFLAAAQNAKANRIQAEQAMFEQQQALWQMLGLPAPAASLRPVGDLPVISASEDAIPEVARRAHEIVRSRPILAYFDDEIAAADVRVEGARVGMRPDINLLTQATTVRVETAGGTGTTLGYYGVVGLQFTFPLQNRTARGTYQQAAEARAQQVLASVQRRNAIQAGLDRLSAAIASIARSYRQRSSAAEQSRLVYEAERVKFRLGNATGMDVVLAEQQFMAASAAAVVDRTAYAISYAQLLHESGALTGSVASRDAATIVRRLTTNNL
jgi:outer membrane protein TolC